MSEGASAPTNSSSRMEPICYKIVSAFVFCLLLISSVCAEQSSNYNNKTKQNFRPREELEKLKHIRAYLKKINKPAVKTIQSPDGDIIDCVLTHLQPAFDHPLLKGQEPIIMELPEMPEGHTLKTENHEEEFQVWTMSGESCPDNTVPIRRTTEEDVLRATSVERFGRKLIRNPVRKDSSRHEHAVGNVQGGQYYGADATINLWAPKVEDTGNEEFSLSQIWVTAGRFDIDGDLNTIEAGWQVDKKFYNDNRPRLFIFWTNDAYNETGCYNLLCPGFVQKSTKIVIGAQFSNISSYDGPQFDLPFLVLKEKRHNNWCLWVNGIFVGYWPWYLFTHLRGHASMVQFGGEIVNGGSTGHHTSTQMGSGHFPQEWFGRASYFRNLHVIIGNNRRIPVSNLQLRSKNPNCYYIQLDQTNYNGWGSYFFYGGPGRDNGANIACT